jgi:quercetin dioxygenase-like cupin family protein
LKMERFASGLFFFMFAVSSASVAAIAQEQGVLDASVAKVEFENDQIRVVRGTVGAHQKTAMHSHPSRLGVTITKNEVRVYLPSGTSGSATRGPNEYFWGEPVTHQVENLSDAPLQNIEIELKRAKTPGVEVKATAGERKAMGTETDPVAVEQEPHHHVVFENQYVRVLEVIVRPGETTLFHRHSLDNVAVQLSDTTIKRQSAGGDWDTLPAKEGSVSFIAGATTPYVHRIADIGSTVFHVLDVEILP